MEKILEYVVFALFLAIAICALILIVLLVSFMISECMTMIKENKKNRKKPHLYGLGYKIVIIDELPDSKPKKHDDSVDHVCRAAEYAAKMAIPINCGNFTTNPDEKLQETYLRNARTISTIKDYLVKNFSDRCCKGAPKMPEFHGTLTFNEAMNFLAKNEGWSLTRLDSGKYIENGYYLTANRNEEMAKIPFCISMIAMHSAHKSKLEPVQRFYPLMDDLTSKDWIAFKF